MPQNSLQQLDLERLSADHPLRGGDLGLILLEQVGCLLVLVERAGLELASLDPDQLAGNVVALGQRVQGLVRDEPLSDLPLERHAV